MSGKKQRNKAGNHKKSADIDSEKKTAVLESAKDGKGGKTVFIGIAVGLLIFAIVGVSLFSEKSGLTAVKAEAGVIRIPIADVSDSKAHYFTYKAAKGNINFFALKSSDGVIRTAFDACDVCYRAKKGYRQEGDYMVCNNCGQRFESVNINEIKGGCNPAPLERIVQGNNLILNAADIENGAWYF